MVKLLGRCRTIQCRCAKCPLRRAGHPLILPGSSLLRRTACFSESAVVDKTVNAKEYCTKAVAKQQSAPIRSKRKTRLRMCDVLTKARLSMSGMARQGLLMVGLMLALLAPT